MISTVILAAGASQRMGRPKQLLPVDGAPMLTRLVQTVLEAELDETIVVLGAAADAVSPLLAGLPLTVVVNPRWEEGLASSIRTGLTAVSAQTQAALFVPCDLPRLQPATIQALVTHFRASGKAIVIPTCHGRRGNPVLFARSLFGDLSALHGEQGGRALFARYPAEIAYVETGDEGILFDIDTLEDYDRLS